MENPYQIIKRSITDGIAAGQWRVGDILPSEHALCRRFAVSRMTVNRAMRELAQDNVITRIPGRGSFVAEPMAQSHLVQIRNIADEIAGRGGVHRATILSLAWARAPDTIASALVARDVFHSVILHAEDGVPIQLEDRFVSPDTAPAYLEQDFSSITPNAYLMRVAPLTDVEHVVQASVANTEIAALLAIPPGAPCLVVHRKTWSAGRPVSVAMLTHPGTRFRLTGKFATGTETP